MDEGSWLTKWESRKKSSWTITLVGNMLVSWRETCLKYESVWNWRGWPGVTTMYIYRVVCLVKSIPWIGYWSDRQPRADVGGDTGPRRAWHSRRTRQCWEGSEGRWNYPSLIYTHTPLKEIQCWECTQIYLKGGRDVTCLDSSYEVSMDTIQTKGFYWGDNGCYTRAIERMSLLKSI